MLARSLVSVQKVQKAKYKDTASFQFLPFALFLFVNPILGEPTIEAALCAQDQKMPINVSNLRAP